jgi:SOCE-associated regulatory factor of calcium homoeostasis
MLATWCCGLEALALSSLLTTSIIEAARSSNIPKHAVLLSSISSLTLRAGKQTSARRSSPIAQAACIGPAEICKLYTVDTIRCTNAGSDYDEENVQWTCTAALPEEFKFGSTDVNCEGYASSDDPYVLKGSCGVEYRLLLTEKGEQKYGKYVKQNNWKLSGTEETASDLVKAFFLIIFVVIFLIIVSSFWNSFRNRRRGGGRPTPFGGGGGGGGGGGDDEPPPPYDYGTPPRKTRRTTYATSGGSGTRQEQWRPGFWTGALGGAAAGYLAGNRNRPRQPETQQRGGGLFGTRTSNTGGSSWFGGGDGNAGEGSSRSSGSSPPAASSSRYTSTGFGSTVRR